MEHLEKLSEAIKKRMREKRLKPKHVYKKAGVSDSFFYKLFAGTAKNVSLNHVQSVFDVLDLEFDIIPKGAKSQAELPIFCNDGHVALSCPHCGGKSLEVNAVRISNDRQQVDTDMVCISCRRSSKCYINGNAKDDYAKRDLATGAITPYGLSELRKSIQGYLDSTLMTMGQVVRGDLRAQVQALVFDVSGIMLIEDLEPTRFLNETAVLSLAACKGSGEHDFHLHIHIGPNGFILRLFDKDGKHIS